MGPTYAAFYPKHILYFVIHMKLFMVYILITILRLLYDTVQHFPLQWMSSGNKDFVMVLTIILVSNNSALYTGSPQETFWLSNEVDIFLTMEISSGFKAWDSSVANFENGSVSIIPLKVDSPLVHLLSSWLLITVYWQSQAFTFAG